MSDDSKGKFSEWLSNLEAPFIFSATFLIFGMLLIALGILQWLPIPKIGTLITDEKFRWVTIIIGLVFCFTSPILYSTLKKNSENGVTDKPFFNIFSAKNGNTKSKFGLNHIEQVVFPYYLEKTPVTTVDKKNAMSAVLRMIALTDFTSSIDNLFRMSIAEVRDNGRFTILAAHLIDAHRVESLESLFNHRPDRVSGVAGYVVDLRETIKINDVSNPPAKYKNVYAPTPYNEIPVYKSGSILAIPIYDDPAHPSTSKILAVLSISSSKVNYFKDTHTKDLEGYCSQIRNLLIHFNNKIRVDPIAIKKFRIITISGESGAGKSALLKELLTYLEPLGWKKIHIGGLFREFCHTKGYTVQEIERVPAEVHREFDDMQAEILKTDSNIIIEGRMSGYLACQTDLQDIVKIYCDLPLDIRARRFANREEIPVQEAERKVIARDNKDLAIYNALYDIEDYRDKQYYDLYLETTRTPDELARIVFDRLNKFDSE